jgi:hypothetical protein
MFGLITFLALLLAGMVILLLLRRCSEAARRAATERTAAALAYGRGYRDATDEINTKRDRESKTSYDKGFESGWNACVTQFEDVGVPGLARAA